MLLVEMWVQCRFVSQLRPIASVTKSASIKEFLEALFEVPPLTIEPTGAEDVGRTAATG